MEKSKRTREIERKRNRVKENERCKVDELTESETGMWYIPTRVFSLLPPIIY